MIIICKHQDYLSKYGKHFNEELCKYAISLMDHDKKALSKEQVDKILNNKIPEKNKLWDYVFVTNMAYNDFYGSSLKDEEHLALYVKDYIDDKDGYDGLPFCRWYTDMEGKNICINLDDMI